jgi:hypothetical protein
MRPINKCKLTQLHVGRISPQAKTFYAWDTEQKGLCLQVRPNGYRAYKVVYQFQGRTRWFHLGAVNEISLGQARKLAQEVMYQKAQGKDPHGERRAQRSAGTFADLVETYFSQHAEKANRSWKQARYLIDRFLLPRWGGLVPNSITRAHVKALMREVTAPVLANQTLATASAIFSWAIREEVVGVTVNPCSKVDRNAVTSRERILSDSELPLFWTAFQQAGEAGKVLKLILLTGQRPGEVSAGHQVEVERDDARSLRAVGDHQQNHPARPATNPWHLRHPPRLRPRGHEPHPEPCRRWHRERLRPLRLCR